MKPETQSKKRGAPPFKANWTSIDWNQADRTLARTYNTSESTIARNRVRFGRPRPQSLIDWTTVDWSKSSAELCRQLGLSAATVSKYRRIHAPDTFPQRRPSTPIDWENVDWTLPTGKLAKQLGIRRNRLYNLRCQYAPHTVAHRRKIPVNLDLDWSLSDLELSKRHNLWPPSVRLRRLNQAPETVRFKDWASIDWNKTNQEIIDQTRATWPTVNKYRRILAPETLRDGRGRPYGSKNQDSEFQGWPSIDWPNLSNKEIMDQMGVSRPTVIKFRAIHAPDTVRPKKCENR